MGKRGPKPGVNVHGDGESWKSSDFSRQRELFAEWMATPKSERRPGSRRAFAGELGVADSTLKVWGRDFGVIRRVGQIRAEKFQLVDLGGVLETLVAIATDSSHRSCVSAGKLVLDWSRDVLDDVSSVTSYQEMSDGELRETLVGLIDTVDDRMAGELEETG